jgi:midasin (ATPase involved in ribosome maturation)
LPFDTSKGSLTTTSQVTNHLFDDIAVRSVERQTRVAMREISSPTPQIPIDRSNDLWDRHEVSTAAGQLADAAWNRFHIFFEGITFR